MNRKEIVKVIAEKSGVGQEKCDSVLNSFIEVLTNSLISGEEVTIRGFGRFNTRDRKARVCRDPRNGEIVEVPEMKVPTFKFSNKMREIISNS